MFWHRLLFSIFSLSLLFMTISPLSQISAQENEIVTAEVLGDNLNVRYAPNAYAPYVYDTIDTQIGQLQRGDTVTVLRYETITSPWRDSSRIPWVYVKHEESGLTGWVYSDYLYFSRADWQHLVPAVHTWRDLAQLEGEDHQPFTATVANYSTVYIRAEPSRHADVLTTIPAGTPILVTGRAVVNSRTTYVYIEEIDGDIAGWLGVTLVNTAISEGWINDQWALALPILYTDETN